MSPAWYIFNNTLQPGIYSTNDGGTSWSNITDNLGHWGGKFLRLNPHNTNQLFLGTDGGDVWIKDLVTTIDDNEVSIPSKFNLDQNYPNPFNPSTRISYQLPTLSKVVLKVYDILGREVTTLVNREQNAGNYKIIFNSSNLSSGIYFYRIVSGVFTQTKKMMVIK